MTTKTRGRDRWHGATPEGTTDANNSNAIINPVASKEAAMWLYNYCGVSREATSAAFARHPEWRSA